MDLISVARKYSNKVIQIKGHSNPDVDSIVAGLLVEKLLSANGIYSVIVTDTQELENETKKLVTKIGVKKEELPVAKFDPDLPTILIDHYSDPKFTNIIACIDHHPTVTKQDYPLYINERYASAAQLIFNRYEDKFRECDNFKRLVYLTLTCSSIDTSGFTSSKALQSCVDWCRDVADKYSFDWNKIVELGFCLNDLNVSIEELALSGLKHYMYGQTKVSASYIQLPDRKSPVPLSQIVENIKKVQLKDNSFWVYMAYYMFTRETDIIIITKENTYIQSVDCILSRGSDIMPRIEPIADKIPEMIKAKVSILTFNNH